MPDASSSALAIAESIATFRSQKDLADRAIAQLSDDQLRTALDENTNSIAIITKHMAGNMLSRWTDFLTTDGEKPWRNRDSEFIDDSKSRREIDEYWQRGWQCLFVTLDSLKPQDLTRTILIRGEPHTVIKAIDRQLSHYGYHVGQIVLIARVLAKDNWTTLTIPRGGSHQYNQRIWKR
ncbi:MAG: DUF1572 domain-containing protein [Phycisphaerales bacterium]|nr:DUF1572 domain-containing protein [Phycisphaerales bacterium]